MRAKRRGTYVYTERGPGAKPAPSPPSPVESVLVTTPNQFISNPPPQVVPEATCPHGGVMLGEVFVCGTCGDEQQQIGLALMHVARKIAWQIPVSTATFDDVMMTAALVLVENQKRILSAKNPTGMAIVIGRRAVLKMYRSKSVKSVAVGKMSLDGPDFETVTQRLDYLDEPRARAKERAQWAAECYERARTFPGIDLVWNAKNFERIQDAINEGKRELPSDQWRIIDMRLGLSEGMGEHGWVEISDHFSDAGKNIPEHQVRRSYHAGLAFLKAHLIKTLLPEKIFNLNEINAVDQISEEKLA
jgi:hypothetical protein